MGKNLEKGEGEVFFFGLDTLRSYYFDIPKISGMLCFALLCSAGSISLPGLGHMIVPPSPTSSFR